MVTKKADEDITIIVGAVSISGETIEYTEIDWVLELWSNSKRLIIERQLGEITNQGVISANAKIVDGNIEVYAKLSKTPLGTGQVNGQITLYIPNDSFEDGMQVVKSPEWKIGLTLT